MPKNSSKKFSLREVLDDAPAVTAQELATQKEKYSCKLTALRTLIQATEQILRNQRGIEQKLDRLLGAKTK